MNETFLRTWDYFWKPSWKMKAVEIKEEGLTKYRKKKKKYAIVKSLQRESNKETEK